MSTENPPLKTALYLDDCRTPLEPLPGYKMWNVVRNYDQFVDYIITNGIPDFISFDHDLADEHMMDYFEQVEKTGWQGPSYDSYKEKTGLCCAKWLVQHWIAEFNQKGYDTTPFPVCSVHSANPVGSDNILGFLNGFKKHMGWPQNCFPFIHKHIMETQVEN